MARTETVVRLKHLEKLKAVEKTRREKECYSIRKTNKLHP